MKKVVFLLGAVVVLVGGVYQLFADGVMAEVKVVSTKGESSVSRINVYPTSATMESVRGKIGSVCAGQCNPDSAIRLDFNNQIVDNDDDLQRILQQDVADGKTPVFYVDKKYDATPGREDVESFSRRTSR